MIKTLVAGALALLAMVDAQAQVFGGDKAYLGAAVDVPQHHRPRRAYTQVPDLWAPQREAELHGEGCCGDKVGIRLYAEDV